MFLLCFLLFDFFFFEWQKGTLLIFGNKLQRLKGSKARCFTMEHQEPTQEAPQHTNDHKLLGPKGKKNTTPWMARSQPWHHQKKPQKENNHDEKHQKPTHLTWATLFLSMFICDDVDVRHPERFVSFYIWNFGMILAWLFGKFCEPRFSFWFRLRNLKFHGNMLSHDSMVFKSLGWGSWVLKYDLNYKICFSV